MPDFPKTLQNVKSMPEVAAMAERRRNDCKQIAITARECGLDVTWERVNYNYATWVRWAEGRLATGYLIKLTGVQYLPTTQESE